MEDSWIKKNWGILVILLFAVAIRIYYFILTKSQPVWYDEGVYLNMAQRFAFGTTYEFGPVRQVFFPFIISLFYKLASSEFLPRLFMLILSVFSVYGIYLLGKEVFNKKVGLIASFFMSIFYLNLFYTYRLLVDLPSLTFFIFSAYFFFKYIKTKKNSHLYEFALMIGIGALFKLSTAFILIACFLFLLFTEGFKFIKRKEIWIAAVIFCLVLLPYIIFGYSEFGGFVLTKASAHVAPENYFNGFVLLWNYLTAFPGYFTYIFFGIILMGLVYSLYRPVLYSNKLKEEGDTKSLLYLFLIFIIPLIFTSFMVNHNEDRYIITCFASAIILGGFVLSEIYNSFKGKIKIVVLILIILLLGFVAFQQLKIADSLIKNKLDSYEEVKAAGLWLKEYSEVYGEGIVATKSQPQIKYYSGLDTINLPPTEAEYEELSTNETQYFILSIFENHPEWSYTYPERKNMVPIQAYFTEKNEPLLVIYQVNDGKEIF